MYASGSKAGVGELSKPLDIGHGAIGVAVFPAGFRSCFSYVFLTMTHYSILEWKCIFCVITCWKYVTCFLILVTLEETLDF